MFTWYPRETMSTQPSDAATAIQITHKQKGKGKLQGLQVIKEKLIM